VRGCEKRGEEIFTKLTGSNHGVSLTMTTNDISSIQSSVSEDLQCNEKENPNHRPTPGMRKERGGDLRGWHWSYKRQASQDGGGDGNISFL